MTQIQFNNSLIELSDRLHYYALSLTSETESADDLLQETLLKALTYREKYKPETNFKAWMYTIMKNTFINNYRRNIRTRASVIDTKSDFHQFASKKEMYPSPDSFYNEKEIKNSINSLNDEYKIPFTMFLDGFKYKEIAEELSLPLGTVKSRIFFTRKKLEKALFDYRNN